MMKENANPIIYTKTDSKLFFQDESLLLGISSIQSFGASSLDEQNTCLAWSSKGNMKNLDIFEEAGLMKKRKDYQFSFPPIDQLSSSVTTSSTVKSVRDKIQLEEVFEMIRNIQDPEHLDLTLEQLNIVNLKHVYVIDNHSDFRRDNRTQHLRSHVHVYITPTIPHCSMATLIGLSVRVKLFRSLPSRFKVSIKIFPGTHASEGAINKQLNDKERVCAALENKHLLKVVNNCIRIK